MEEKFRQVLDDFLIEGDEDYIGLWEIYGEVSHIIDIDTRNLHAGDSDKLLQATLVFIIMMLRNGFEVVDLHKDGTSTVWPDQSPANVSQTIAAAWKKAGNDPTTLCFSFWLNKINKNLRKR